MSLPRTLDVYLGDTLVGSLSGADTLEFRYRQEGPAISLSLPVRDAPYGDAATRTFFTNLFFENRQLDEVIAKHGLDRNDIVGILTHLGRDCPGAISVVPEGAPPGKRPGLLSEDYVPIEDEGELMRRLARRRLGNDGGDPSPLAGVQGKIAVTAIEGRLHLPINGAPSTHILKVPRPEEASLVGQEYHLLRIAAAAQAHPVTRAQIHHADGVDGLLITRYDRRVENGQVDRIHQEDFCQALGLHPLLKYERNGTPERRFSAQAVGQLLGQTRIPAIARQSFLMATALNLALGNTDNHAKNHSLLYLEKKPVLAPLYDIVPILLDQNVTHEFAFRIGAAKRVEDLGPESFQGLAEALGFGRHNRVPRAIETLFENLASALLSLPNPSQRALTIMIEDQLSLIHERTGLGPHFPDRDLFVRPA